MRLSVTAPPGTDLGVGDSPDCVGKFVDGLINGCDGNDPSNPYNSKYGGTFTTGDGWVFSFEPLAHQGLANNCQTEYQFSALDFDIRGINFDPAVLGDHGEGLKYHIENDCGWPIIWWGFELTPNDCCFQWHASGKTAVGLRGCLGKAIVAAGGENDQCAGSG
jgi:hypothetical protein